MRKLIIAAILIIPILSLSSCIGGSRVAMLNRTGDSGKAEARCEQIVNAINSRDRAAITAVFSETALSEAEDIDGGIDYLFSLFESEIETWEVTMGRGSESINDGHKTKSNDFYFTTYSGEKEFRVYIREDIIDTEHPENVGVYYIKATDSTDESFENSKYYLIGGIHVPFDEDGAARIRFEKVFNLIKDKDKDAIRALFSKKALSEARDIDREIDELLNFFPNGIDSWEQERRVARRWIEPNYREINTDYVYTVYADGEAYWFQIGEYLDWTGKPEIVGVNYILISRPDTKEWFKLYSGINIWEESKYLTPNDETVTVFTLDEGVVKTTMETENISYTFNATQNTRNFYFVEVFTQRESTTPLRKISQYTPCNRLSEYAVMGMDMSKSSEELEMYSYIPFSRGKQGFEWAPFKWKPLKLTEEITAYTYIIEESSYTKFTFNGCKYKITGATKEDCLAIMDKLSAFPDLEEVYAVYGNGVLGSIEVMFIKERYKYFLRTLFAEDLDGFAAMLTAMQKEPPDDNDFTRSLIEFMDGQCLVPILLPSGSGPFTNAQ